MHQYDPLAMPDPQQWLATDESRRITLVKDYHRRARIRVPNAQIHAVAHVIVENQIALAEAVPVATMNRLMQEGLDRHEAVHAIATVVMEVAYGVMSDDPIVKAGAAKDPNQRIYASLEELTAVSIGVGVRNSLHRRRDPSRDVGT